MKIRKKETQILLINQKLIDKAAESKRAMEKKKSDIILLKNMLDRQQSGILKQGEQWAKEKKIKNKQIANIWSL